MSKVSQIDQAIASLEAEKAIIQHAIDKLRGVKNSQHAQARIAKKTAKLPKPTEAA